MNTPFADWLRQLLVRMCVAISDPRPRERAVKTAFGLICGQMPKTITSAMVFNKHQGDWSAYYRLFSACQWEADDLFAPVLEEALRYSVSGPIVAAIDDTLLRKTGRQIPGTAYARDSQSPAFHTNLVLGQRFLELALLVRANEQKPYRAIPVTCHHAPPLKAPARASKEVKAAVKELAKKHNMSTIGRALVAQLRARIDQVPGGRERPLLIAADGSFANKTFLRYLPANTTAVCRIRKDAKLRLALPRDQARLGNRKYGDELPTPEAMLADPAIPLRTLTLHNGYREVTMQFKIIQHICWPKVTGEHEATAILIKPLHYRLRKGEKLLYKQPCYLFVVGAPVDLEQALRAALGRWEIEVAFRDQKTIMGVGQAQVWNPSAVASVPAFQAATYGALLLASLATLNDTRSEQFPPRPRWQKRPACRPSTRDLVNLVRKQLADANSDPPSTPAQAS